MPNLQAGEAVAPRDLIGRDPMTLAQLVEEVNKAHWPAFVKVAPQDFVFLVPSMAMGFGVQLQYDKDTGLPYLMLGPTKVVPKESKGFKDLTEWEQPKPSLIALPR